MSEQTAPVVRMDRSRDFGTVTGERTPDSVHATLHFIQNGLPFDSEGVLIHDHVFFEPGNERPSKNAMLLRERAEKLIARAAKSARPRRPDGDAAPDDDGDDAEVEEGQTGQANLDSWARGEVRVPWQEVTQAIARRFSKRVANKRDALDLLLEERVVAKADLSEEHRKIVDG